MTKVLYDANGITLESIPEFMKRLREPFKPAELRFRIGSKSKTKNSAMVFTYIEARHVQSRLDELAGPYWKVKYESHPGTEGVLATLSIKINGEWISRQDGAGIGRGSVGDELGIAEKASFSDALKRAGVTWGIGRELYEWPEQWLKIDDRNSRNPQFIEFPRFPNTYNQVEVEAAKKVWEKENAWRLKNKGSNTSEAAKPPKRDGNRQAPKEPADQERLAKAGSYIVPEGLPGAGTAVKDLGRGLLGYFAKKSKVSNAYFVPTDEQEQFANAAAYFYKYGESK